MVPTLTRLLRGTLTGSAGVRTDARGGCIMLLLAYKHQKDRRTKNRKNDRRIKKEERVGGSAPPCRDYE